MSDYRSTYTARPVYEWTHQIDLGYMNEAAAARVRHALDGKSFMDFNVSIGRTPGGFAVTVASDYDAPAVEVITFAMSCLASA